MKFFHYAIISQVATFLFVAHAYATHAQFYPAVVYLLAFKPSFVVICNEVFVSVIAFGMLVNKAFLGKLRVIEYEHVFERLRYAFIELCLALASFRLEMSASVVSVLVALLFSKVFHWLCEARVEHIEQSRTLSRTGHARLLFLMSMLLFTDSWATYFSLSLVQHHGVTVQVFFGFEYCLLALYMLETFAKYILAAVDIYIAQDQWHNKSLYELYVKLVIDISQLIVNVVFFAAIFMYYGIPMHLIRQLYIAIRSTYDRLTHFWRFHRITANLHERFPDATEEDLQTTDRICIICRETMIACEGTEAPKKLVPCSHIFHFYCLRNWLERQLKCPTCRSDIHATNPGVTPTARAQNPAANNNDVNNNAVNNNAVRTDTTAIPANAAMERQGISHGAEASAPERAATPNNGLRLPENRQVDSERRPQEPAVQLSDSPQPVQPKCNTDEFDDEIFGHDGRPPASPVTSNLGSSLPPFDQALPCDGYVSSIPRERKSLGVVESVEHQIELFRLQLEIYQAQLNAAKAAKEVQAAADVARTVFDRQSQKSAPSVMIPQSSHLLSPMKDNLRTPTDRGDDVRLPHEEIQAPSLRQVSRSTIRFRSSTAQAAIARARLKKTEEVAEE